MSLFAPRQRCIFADLARPLCACALFVVVLFQPLVTRADSLPQFLIVDYHPISKTLVQDGPSGATLSPYAALPRHP